VAEAFAGAREGARRALALEERADAHLVLGRTALAHDWDFGHAEREIRRALVLEPSSVAAWVSLARLHSAKGDHDAAIQAARRAEALDPASPAAVEELAWCYYRARRPDEAARQFRRVGERRPEEAHHVLFAMFREAGRYQEALSQAQAVMQRAGVPEADRLRLRHLPPEAAATAFLRGTVAHLRREAGHHRVPPERLALLHAALGERAAAIGWLSRAADERSPGLVTALVDPALDRLRAEPEFVSLLGRVRARALGAS
jgi:Flp pilus assembly protein TadD